MNFINELSIQNFFDYLDTDRPLYYDKNKDVELVFNKADTNLYKITIINHDTRIENVELLDKEELTDVIIEFDFLSVTKKSFRGDNIISFKTALRVVN